MDFCVCCGAYVPEGTMVCKECRRKYAVIFREKKVRHHILKKGYK